MDAGKHVYMAKPVAVDVPGCKSVLASGKKAQEKKLTYWVDFQTRSREVYKELATRVHRGDIGKPVLAQVFYYAGRPSKDRARPGWTPGSGACPISIWTRCWAATSSWSRIFT